MREIKFRAYDNRLGIMRPPVDIWHCGSDGEYGEYWGEKWGFNWTEQTIMQYTGLKDKNGKEIYEGDIVKTSIGKQVVEDLFCNFVIYTYEDIDRMNQPEKHFEVIGNIYSNPELLPTERKGKG